MHSYPSPLPHLTYWLYAKWFQTKHTGGHATASYASLSMGDYLRETSFAAIQLCLSTTTNLLFHRKPIYNQRSLPAKTPTTQCPTMLCENK